MSFSDREKQLIRAAFAWGQVSHKEGYTLSDGEIEKSVLFRRLLAGRPPLAFPPPLRHGFPWYEVIEGRGQHVVNASEASEENSMIAPGSRPGDKCILIDGAFWRVAETIREREEYIVEWGPYPMQWRLRKHWEVNYEMTQQLQNFRKHNPDAEIHFDNRVGQREYSEFRIDEDQTVWLSEWQLSRIGLSGWVWVGTLLDSGSGNNLAVLGSDQHGPLILGEPGRQSGEAWLRIERAGEEYRFIRLGEQIDYDRILKEADAGSLLHGIQDEDLLVMDWSDGAPLQRFSVPAQLAPLEEFNLDRLGYELVPDNLFRDGA
ncbi:hypothetical protein [Microbulbifer sediminum]|uniref:hypothetical protein n=1 Tax=Microbulbifer sediminum TaxID=2904250 RepID=UPI001F4091D3|nr:hypothetical protein [Microbulbifer sediminum]